MIDITIPGAPVAKGRGRATKQGRVFTPARTRKAEETLAGRAMAMLDGIPGLPLSGPLRLDATFTSTMPASWSAKKRAAAVAPTSRPDVDNLLKLATDALNGVVWVDDAQIVTITCRKVYGDAPSTRLIVTPIVVGERDDLREQLASAVGALQLVESDGDFDGLHVITQDAVRDATRAARLP